MGKSASEVRAEIEDTRQEMSETIDAIADRTSPRRIIDRRRQAMSRGMALGAGAGHGSGRVRRRRRRPGPEPVGVGPGHGRVGGRHRPGCPAR